MGVWAWSVVSVSHRTRSNLGTCRSADERTVVVISFEMSGQRRRRQSHAVVICCCAAPATALNFARAPGRTMMNPTVPQAGYTVQREQTLSLFWTERVNDPVNGLGGCVRTAARDEVAAGVQRTVASGVDPNCLAVDSLQRTLYWSDRSKGAITRASVDCDKAELIAEGCFGHRHLDGPWGSASWFQWRLLAPQRRQPRPLRSLGRRRAARPRAPSR